MVNLSKWQNWTSQAHSIHQKHSLKLTLWILLHVLTNLKIWKTICIKRNKSNNKNSVPIWLKKMMTICKFSFYKSMIKWGQDKAVSSREAQSSKRSKKKSQKCSNKLIINKIKWIRSKRYVMYRQIELTLSLCMHRQWFGKINKV